MNSSPLIVGLDIGGANIKLATSDGLTRSIPFELWKYPDRLSSQIDSLLSDIGHPIAQILATMTGELCDCFETKEVGVLAILDALEKSSNHTKSELKIWAIGRGLVSCVTARSIPLQVAAANWHAQATWLASEYPDGFNMLLDVGSTTTDIIPLHDGKVIAKGLTDFDRLETKELIYQGTRRTPICAFAFEGICNEFFASVQDAYVTLGLIPESIDDTATADGRRRTIKYSLDRLARMLGADRDTISMTRLTQFAERIILQQQEIWIKGLRTVQSRVGKPLNRVILTGSGEFATARLMMHPEWKDEFERVQIVTLRERIGTLASDAACAFALVQIANSEHQV
jgi:(4-(4-[2-(gamma-L-glutamylamino)ethyl]phenoxymethyl)furan-2-yl)methanamine synthase